MATSIIKVSNYIIAERVTLSTGLPSIPAGSSAHTDIDVSKSGYTPLGIIEVSGSGNNGLVLQDFYLQGSTAIIYQRNVTNAAKAANEMMVKVLYAKN